MTDTLTDTYTRAEITLRGGDGMCVGHFPLIPGETDDQLEGRWDSFAALMFRCGLEPVGDEPTRVTAEAGVTIQHYELAEVEVDDDVSAA